MNTSNQAQFYNLTEKRKNKVNLFIRECITTAFFRLIEKKDFNKITISEIIKESGVSRMGFYRNFTSKENILEDYIYQCFTDTIENIEEQRPLCFKTKNIVITTLTNFQKHADKMKLLIDKNLSSLLYDCYVKAFYSLYNNKSPSRIREYSTQMFIGELFNLEMCWIKNGMKETPEELTRIYQKILKIRSYEK